MKKLAIASSIVAGAVTVAILGGVVMFMNLLTGSQISYGVTAYPTGNGQEIICPVADYQTLITTGNMSSEQASQSVVRLTLLCGGQKVDLVGSVPSLSPFSDEPLPGSWAYGAFPSGKDLSALQHARVKCLATPWRASRWFGTLFGNHADEDTAIQYTQCHVG